MNDRNCLEKSRRSPARHRASASNAPRRCLRAGARVVLVDRAEDALKHICAELGPQGHIPWSIDLTEPDEASPT